ncbi:uncharacterized protein LOC102618496 isoform X1 [Citrus sinensis]|nr:uncharacterized protein LOC18041752 [Citrus x clementina]XP_052296489.1 uncharacterized protein LOC102618496 isoform X1 [Citrus sinensis]
MRHRVKPLSAVISHRRGTAPSLANQPPKLTAVLATHHHNTLPLPANTPQNLLKTSSHNVQVAIQRCEPSWWENNEVQGVEALRKILLPTKYLYFSQIECLLVCLSKPRGGLGNSHPLKKA